jgi:outer membrane protein assembly factor BamB
MHSKKLLFLLLFLSACSNKKTELLWGNALDKIGSQSSPKATDINNDGVLDVIMGAGENEYQSSENGIIALDGKTGELIWQHESIDQVYGSATLLDINADGIQDVFIGGRSNQFYALNGATGENIWQWTYAYENEPKLKYAKYNFHNAVLIPDQTGDKIQDLLVVCGGNSKAEPNSLINRFTGVLMILDSKNGKVIAADTMPDGLESYMPPLYIHEQEAIIFGTGGETINGSLYKTQLLDLLKGDISQAKVIASDTSGHGFIAPCVAVDLNDDGQLDIAAISHGSYIYAIDGKTSKSLWALNIPDTESSNGFAVGYFNSDKTPDLFTFVSKGVWPESTGSVQIVIDGKTGEKYYSNSLGCTGFSSPVVYDLNHDGTDEAIISINEYDCNKGFISEAKLDISTRLIAMDFKNNQIHTIDQQTKFKNIFSTPYIGDMDDDGFLDIVHTQYFSPNSILLSFMGMKVKRISTNIKLQNEVKWGAYMGSNGDGIFRK